jgi:superfamily II DNA/RNA helicase
MSVAAQWISYRKATIGLVATDIAALDIHIDGIAHVVTYDLPQVPEDFYPPRRPYRARRGSRDYFPLQHRPGTWGRAEDRPDAFDSLCA